MSRGRGRQRPRPPNADSDPPVSGNPGRGRGRGRGYNYGATRAFPGDVPFALGPASMASWFHTLRDEARSTAERRGKRRENKNGDQKLRYQPVQFTSGGLIEPLKELEKQQADEARASIDPVAASMVAQETDREQMEGGSDRKPLSSIDMITTKGKGKGTMEMCAKQEDEDEDEDENQYAEAGNEGNETDSSVEIILFKGRDNLRRFQTSGSNSGMSKTETVPITTSDPTISKLTKTNTAIINTTTASNTNSNTTVATTPVRMHKENIPLSKDTMRKTDKMEKEAKEEKIDAPATPDVDEHPLLKRFESSNHSDIDDELVADYMANMDREYQDGDARSSDASPAFHSLRDIGASDTDAMPELDDMITDDTTGNQSKAIHHKAQARVRVNKSYKIAPNRAGHFPSATMMADSFDDLDLMDRDRPSITQNSSKKKKNHWIQHDDSDFEVAMNKAVTKDRAKKAAKKQERQDLRAQGLLGKKKPELAFVDLSVKYLTVMQRDEVIKELESFMLGMANMLVFPPLIDDAKDQINGVALDLHISTAFIGEGVSCHNVLFRNFPVKSASDFDRQKFAEAVADNLQSLTFVRAKAGSSPTVHDVASRYPTVMYKHDIFEELKQFLQGSALILTFPPLDNNARSLIHKAASRLDLESESLGSANNRHNMLYRYSVASVPFDQRAFTSATRIFRRPFFPRQDIPAGLNQDKTPKERTKFSLTYAAGTAVGHDASELGEDNKGRLLLEKMGWSKGMSLGSEQNQGITVPIKHLVRGGKSCLGVDVA